MPASTNKRRRISDDGKSSPVKNPEETGTISPQKAHTHVLPSFMTPTKASLAKSFPHLVPKSPVRGAQNKPVSPLRQPPRRRIPPEQTGGLTEVIVHGGTDNSLPGRSFLDIANEPDGHEIHKDGEPTGMAVAMGRKSSGGKEVLHLSNEEEIEKYRGVLMRRVRMLRAECEDLEKQVDQAQLATQTSKDAQDKAQADIDATIQLLLRSNDSSLSRHPLLEIPKQSLPTAAPKKLKNPLPLLRFIHPLTFYSTISQQIPQGDNLIRQFELKGYTLERELYFDISLSVNEKEERITNLEIRTSPWSHAELSPYLSKFASTRNAQMALTALSTYAKLSSQRSLTFSKLATEFPHLLLPSVSAIMTPTSRKGKERAGMALPPHRRKRIWLGERNITFQQGPVILVFRWDITIDSLGFAQNKISLASRFPEICMVFVEYADVGRDVDENGTLLDLEGIFDSFVRKVGVEAGTRGIIGVVFDRDE